MRSKHILLSSAGRACPPPPPPTPPAHPPTCTCHWQGSFQYLQSVDDIEGSMDRVMEVSHAAECRGAVLPFGARWEC